MIYKHPYLGQSFLDNKTIHKVTEDKPLVVLLSKKFTFLNDFIVYSLRLNRVPFEVKQTDEEEVISHRLPAIAFKDYFLSQQTAVQFVADLMLQRESLTDLMERKTLGKQNYKKWIDVIKEENTGLCNFNNLSSLGIQTQQDYLNHLFSQFLAMASWIRSDILQRKYEGFRRHQINFETLLVYDIVNSILKLCQKTKFDHILRAHFENLIDFHDEFKTKIQGVLNQENEEMPVNEIQVVTDKVEEAPVIQYNKFTEHWKRFTIVFTIAAGVYLKWVE